MGAGLAARRLARPAAAGSSTSSKPAEGLEEARPVVIFPGTTSGTPCARWTAAAREHGAGQSLPRAALGRVGQVEHDRLAGPPAVVAARRRRHEGVRQGRRDHRPAWCSTGSCRTRSTSSSTPTASRCGSTRDSPAARRRAGRRAGPDHHHDAAEVPVRPRQDRVAARPPLRRDRRRGALVADRRRGQGPR